MNKAIGLMVSIASTLSLTLAAQSNPEITNNTTVNNTRASALKANMRILQTLVELYAIDSGGVYPKNISDLIKAAKKYGHYQEIRNPYSGQQGFSNSITYGLAKTGCKEGFVYYQTPATVGIKDADTIPESSYEISGCLTGQQPIMNDTQPFVISNIEPEKPNVPSTDFQKTLSNLKSPDAETRYAAIIALVQQQDKRAVLPLIETLKDEDEDVRYSAAGALGELKDKRAVQPLIETLKEEAGFSEQRLLKVLGNLGDKRAVLPLIEALKDEEWSVREKAAKVLGELGDKRAVLPLIEALKDENEYIRKAAVTALGELEDKRAVLPLIEALKDEDEYVRAKAAEALGPTQR